MLPYHRTGYDKQEIHINSNPVESAMIRDTSAINSRKKGVHYLNGVLPGLFTDHNPSGGSVRSFHNLTGRVRSGRVWSDRVGWGRIGSGRVGSSQGLFEISQVASGRVVMDRVGSDLETIKIAGGVESSQVWVGSGRVGSGRVVTREMRFMSRVGPP